MAIHEAICVRQRPYANPRAIYVFEELPELGIISNHRFQWESLIAFEVKVLWVCKGY